MVRRAAKAKPLTCITNRNSFPNSDTSFAMTPTPGMPFNVDYLSHRELDVDGDIVYFVRVTISGAVLVRTRDNQYLEGIGAEIYVRKEECRSNAPEDLLRCAMRRLAQLSCEAYEIAARRTHPRRLTAA
jgi:hypothetical protein